MRSRPDDSKVPLPAELYALIGSAACVAVGFGIVAPILPQYASSFNISTFLVTTVISAFAFFRLAFAPVSGTLVDRIGERRTYIAGLLIVAASTAAIAFAQSFSQLLIFRALGGIGSTMFTVSAMGLIVRLAPAGARGRASSAFASAFITGTLVGPLIGGVLGRWGLQVPFLVYAAGLLIGVAVAIRFIPANGAHNSTNGAHLRELRVEQALKHKAYRSVLATAFFNGWATFGVRIAIIPLFVIAIMGTDDPFYPGLVMTIFALGNVATVRISGGMSDRWGRRPLLMAGFVTSGVATVFLALSDNLFLIVAMSLIAGAGTGLFNAPLQATTTDIVGSEHRGGKVIAGQQMMQDLGGIIGPLAAGFIVDHYGYSPAFVITGMFLVAAAAVWFFSPETSPAVTEPKTPRVV